MTAALDARLMARALHLADRGRYTARPNPVVGCVLARDAEVLGEGAHLLAGEAHAEVMALQQAGARAQGATAYVTLEPCSHHGRTPPCAEALIQAGVARVVVAMEDPNPQVGGRGIKALLAAGVAVETGLQAASAEALNPGFVRRMRTGLPWVRVKLASSLDGRIAMATGESQWITGPAARQDVQRLRARSCAVVTGVDTVLADDPRLTVRCEDWMPEQLVCEFLAAHPPLRVVVDSSLRTPADARLFTEAGDVLLACVNSGATGTAHDAKLLLPLPADSDRVDLHALLRELAARECNEVLVEAGPRLAGAFLRAGLVDELWWYQAPILIGHEGRPALDLPGLQRLDQVPRLQFADCRMVGADQRLILRSKGGS